MMIPTDSSLLDVATAIAAGVCAAPSNDFPDVKLVVDFAEALIAEVRKRQLSAHYEPQTQRPI